MNKTWTALLLAALLLPGSLHAKGAMDRDPAAEDLSGISRVRFSAPGTLHISQGSSEQLKVEPERLSWKFLELDIQGEEIIIRQKPALFSFTRHRIQIYLTLKDIKSVLTTGSGDIRIGPVNSRELFLGSDSSGDIQLEAMEGEFLDAKLTSSGDITVLSGNVTSQRISCSSSGDYRGAGFRTETAEVSLSSSGNAEINTSARLTARMTSSGDLRLQGSPVIDSLEQTSSGSLRRN